MVGLGISEPSTCSAGQSSFLQPAPPVRFASKAILEAVQLASPRYSDPKEQALEKLCKFNRSFLGGFHGIQRCFTFAILSFRL